MEADFLRYYQLDVRDVGSPGFTWRRLSSLISRLPADSQTVRAQVGERGQWTTTEHLLATIADELAGSNFILTRAHFKARGLQAPKPIIRPGDRRSGKSRRTSLAPEQMAAKLADLKLRDKRRRAAT